MQKTNSKAKIFIVLIPLFIIIAAFIYDNVLMSVQQKKYRIDTENIIKDVLTNSYSEKEDIVKRLYEEKKLEVEQLNVRYENDILYIYNVHTYPAFFGYVFGIKSYRTEVNLKAYKDEENNIKIEEIKEV